MKSCNETLIYLKELEIDDVTNEYVNWLNDKDVNQFLETRFNKQNLTTVNQFVSSMVDSETNKVFTIRTTLDDKHIGNVKIGNIQNKHSLAELSLFIGNKYYWGKGIGTKALELAIEHAFKKLNIRKLSAGIYTNNHASLKSFLKAKFKIEAEFVDHFMLDDDYCNIYYLTLFNLSYSK
ncbi:MAG: ribosomal-protein-alanine N-acetyltransferase [Francisellaceae bacterium]|jgi:ribosomal-protein-alanine N-acetyltransferase